MISSMTGYGSATLETTDAVARVEIKSLNSRNLDLSVRLPKSWYDKEISLRTRLGSLLQRGKVSVNIELEYVSDSIVKKAFNKDLLLAYYNEVKAIADEAGADSSQLLPALLNNSDIMQPPMSAPDDKEWQLVEQAMNTAITNFLNYRKTEGEALEKELGGYIRSISNSLVKVDEMKDGRIERIKTELLNKLKELGEEGRLDNNRLEQELIYYAEKLDITEEIVRLRTHLGYFMDTMKEEAAGKKLGFISQEIGREINTIGAKANDAGIQRFIVEMKEELEKIKEQVLNIL